METESRYGPTIGTAGRNGLLLPLRDEVDLFGCVAVNAASLFAKSDVNKYCAI